MPGIAVDELHCRRERDPRTGGVDVRDPANRRASGMVDGAIAVSPRTLPVVADSEAPEEWRDPRLQDRPPPVVTVCDLGPISTLAATMIAEMGFADVAHPDGTRAWQETGPPTQPAPDAEQGAPGAPRSAARASASTPPATPRRGARPGTSPAGRG